MSSYTVTNNMYLRNLYKSTDSSLVKGSNRKEASKPKLIIADTTALQKGISSLADEDYGDPDEEDEEITKANFYKKRRPLPTLITTRSTLPLLIRRASTRRTPPGR